MTRRFEAPARRVEAISAGRQAAALTAREIHALALEKSDPEAAARLEREVPRLRAAAFSTLDKAGARAALAALAAIGSREAIAALVEILEKRPTLERAGEAGAALARTPGWASVNAVIELARRGDEPARLAALAVLEMMSNWWSGEPPDADAAGALAHAGAFLKSEGLRIAAQVRDAGASALTRREAARLVSDIPLLR